MAVQVGRGARPRHRRTRRFLGLVAGAAASTALGILLFLLWFASDGPAWRADSTTAFAGEEAPGLKDLEQVYARRMSEMRITIVDPLQATVQAKVQGLTREEVARRLLLGDVASKGFYTNVMTDDVLLARVDRYLAWPYAQRFAFLGFAKDGGGRGLGPLQPWCVVMPAQKGITFGAANHETALAGGLPFPVEPLPVDWNELLTLHELEHCIEYDEHMSDWLPFMDREEEGESDPQISGESWADAGASLEYLLRGEAAAVALLADLRALAFARQVAAGRVTSVKHFTSPVLWQLLRDFAGHPPDLRPLAAHRGSFEERRRRAYLETVRNQGLERLFAGGFRAAVERVNREERSVALEAVEERLVEAGLLPEIAQSIGGAIGRYLALQRCQAARDPALALCLDRDSEGTLFWRTLPRNETRLAARSARL